MELLSEFIERHLLKWCTKFSPNRRFA
jgi:TorA maturation chaperone TorD